MGIFAIEQAWVPPFRENAPVDGFRVVVITAALWALVVYLRAAALSKNHAKGGMPAAYVPSNVALSIGLMIAVTELANRFGKPLTWRSPAFAVMVSLAHWSFHRMGLTPRARRHRKAVISPATLRVLRQVEALGEATFTMDAEGVCVDVNGLGVALLGYSREEMVGHNLHALTHYKKLDGSPFPAWECPLYQAMTENRAVREVDTFLWDRYGRAVEVCFSATPVVEDGRVTGGVVVFSEKVPE